MNKRLWIILLALAYLPAYGASLTEVPTTAMPPNNRIHWQSCLNSEFQPWFAETYPPKDLRCGYLSVPLKYQESTSIEHAENRQYLRLAVTLLPAKSTRKGSLISISGGPGMPGINPLFSPEWPVARLREHYDILGFDPRGVGQSTPKIACPVQEQFTEAYSNTDPATTEQWMRSKMAACITHTGSDVLQHISTDEAVNDLDRLRQALGEAKLTAIGFSYGSKVAGIYAERFPDKVRALVLDGVVDITEDDFTQRLAQARSYQQSFERFAIWCEQTGSCPLTSDKQQSIARYHALLRKLDSAPLHLTNGQPLTSDDFITLTHSLLLWRELWPDLATAFRQLDAGLVSHQVTQLIAHNSWANFEDALDVINCADGAVPMMSREKRLEHQQLLAQTDLLSNDSSRDDVFPTMCDFWPWPGKVSAHKPMVSHKLPQLLFVAQRHDPTTPWENARNMANAFNSPLLTRERDGHTLALVGIDECVDNLVVDYLLAPEKQRIDMFCR